MSDQPAVHPQAWPGAADQADAHRGLRTAALIAVAAGVLLLAAAAFVLSYAGIHAIALKTGVSPRLARLYPLIFDAMLVVAGAAVLALRGAGLITRCYTWLTMLLLLAAVAGADALHATGTRIPHRPAAAAVAIVPWALVLISFGLLLAMLRHARQRRAGGPADRRGQRALALAAPQVAPHGQDRSRWPAALPAPPYSYQPDTGAELAVDADAGQDDPTSDEATMAGIDPAEAWLPDDSGETAEPDENGESDENGEAGSSAMRPLDRMWSPPTPPGS